MSPVPQCQRAGNTSQTWKVCLVRSPDSLAQMPTRAEIIWGESTLRVENPRQGYPGTKVISAETKKGERSYLITSRIRYLWVIIGLYHSYETVTFLQAPYLNCSHIEESRSQTQNDYRWWKHSCNTVLIKIERVKVLRHVRFFATPWTVAHHTPPSMGFSRQEYWSGLPFPSPEDLPDPGIKPGSSSL